MSYKTIEQLLRDKALEGVKKMQPNTPSQTFNDDDVKVKFIYHDARGLKAKAEVYYRGYLVGEVKVLMSFEAVFEAKV